MNLYIHVPFCSQRCNYCDFYTQTSISLRSSYLKALYCELTLRREELSTGAQIEHIYLGGGTPSLLTTAELSGLFSHIYTIYPVSNDAEITLEANPDDLTKAYIKGLKDLPVNRLSMGVQSFQESELRFLNRRHNCKQVYTAVELLRKYGIDNISLDLIYGLPKQTLDTWQDNLKRIIEILPPHISAYHLIYEAGTSLTRMRDMGCIQEVSEDLSLLFFETLITSLSQAGYEHYEISNFARNGAYAKLNTGYWLDNSYLGFGPSAHSYNGVERSYNVASIKDYIEASKQGRRSSVVECLSIRDKINEYIMTRLRTCWGLNIDDFCQRFGAEAWELLYKNAVPYIRRDELLINGRNLQLSSKGIFISDAICVALFFS